MNEGIEDDELSDAEGIVTCGGFDDVFFLVVLGHDLERKGGDLVDLPGLPAPRNGIG